MQPWAVLQGLRENLHGVPQLRILATLFLGRPLLVQSIIRAHTMLLAPFDVPDVLQDSPVVSRDVLAPDGELHASVVPAETRLDVRHDAAVGFVLRVFAESHPRPDDLADGTSTQNPFYAVGPGSF